MICRWTCQHPITIQSGLRGPRHAPWDRAVVIDAHEGQGGDPSCPVTYFGRCAARVAVTKNQRNPGCRCRWSSPLFFASAHWVVLGPPWPLGAALGREATRPPTARDARADRRTQTRSSNQRARAPTGVLGGPGRNATALGVAAWADHGP
jgi:hypothetical protein